MISAFLTPASAQGWPEKYDGVMLQGFYWDSYSETQWTTLENQSDTLSKYFQLIWVPNSGYCNTTSNNMGYLPVYWFNHLSAFGSEASLRSMINTFKSKGTGIIEDVVINHKNGNTDWCDFVSESWNGNDISWALGDICSTDEAAKAGYNVTGAADTGDDFDGGRDLDHTSSNVQNNVKVYLNYLLNDLGYAGFRYDMVKGYAPEYTGMYNSYASPTYSVGEYWDAAASKVKKWIDGTTVGGAVQSAAFDFPLRYSIKSAFEGGSFQALVSGSLASDASYRRYAVTFVDNHDTGAEKPDGSPLTKNVEAANAFILAMPGTPCIYLSHWRDYKTTIKKLILLRRIVGINNQSDTNIEAFGTNGIRVTTSGNNGTIVFDCGTTSAGDYSAYQLAYENSNGINFKIYVDKGLDLTAVNAIADEVEEPWAAPSFCTPESDALYAFFEAPSTWTNTIKCWCWNSKENFTGGTWPGTECTLVGTADNGNKVYKWVGKYGSALPTGIIFSNNGSPQTSDMTFENGGYYDSTGKLYGKVTSGISEIFRDDNKDCKVYLLDGTQTAEPAGKGIYIINGKKYVIN